VLRWFAQYGDRAHHVALTAVPRACAHISASWVMRHFGSWIRTFAFVPSARGARVPGPHATKADYIQWWGRGDIFVDDREDNARAARDLGLTAIVVPQPWNRSAHQSFAAALDRLDGLVGAATAERS
jgi:hypothetical protein